MSSNITPKTVVGWTVEQQHLHLKDVHKHLRHASTSDSPDEIRERLRRQELALQRYGRQLGMLRS